MSWADADSKVLARIALVHDAEDSRGKMSGMAWQERAEESDEGQLVGWREIEAISMLIFGRKPLRRHG
jgi:hypothetical protein